MQLTLRDICKTYPNGVQALNKVSLTIPVGMYGLLGPNGAGKSTLMRTLATLQEADRGSVTLEGAARNGVPSEAIDVLRDKDAVRRQLGYLSLLVYRQGPEVSVLSDRCSHLGGPLHQGRIVVERGAACVACPWHGSTFVIADGTVVHGPATARQPSFETRVTADGRVELRPRP